MRINGYKAFNSDKTNRYGLPFEEGADYHVDGPVSFGNDGNGFHMCTHLSDVFRYFDPDDVIVASVIGSGEYVVRDDENWMEPYYDMYVVSDLHINKFLTREEIINIIINSSSSDIIKFFATFNINDKEKVMFARKFRDNYDVMKALMYYQYGFKDVYFKNNIHDCVKKLEKVILDGQDNNQRGKGK